MHYVNNYDKLYWITFKTFIGMLGKNFNFSYSKGNIPAGRLKNKNAPSRIYYDVK